MIKGKKWGFKGSWIIPNTFILDYLLQNFRHKREDEVFAFMSYSLEIVQQKKIHEWRKCKTSSTLLNAKKILWLNILYAIYAMASSIKKSNISFKLFFSWRWRC